MTLYDMGQYATTWRFCEIRVCSACLPGLAECEAAGKAAGHAGHAEPVSACCDV